MAPPDDLPGLSRVLVALLEDCGDHFYDAPDDRADSLSSPACDIHHAANNGAGRIGGATHNAAHCLASCISRATDDRAGSIQRTSRQVNRARSCRANTAGNQAEDVSRAGDGVDNIDRDVEYVGDKAFLRLLLGAGLQLAGLDFCLLNLFRGHFIPSGG